MDTSSRFIAEHLIDALGDYEIEIDWKGSKYAGIDLDFDYRKRKVYLSMLGYVKRVCKRFNHEMPKRKQVATRTHQTKLWSQGTICKRSRRFKIT